MAKYEHAVVQTEHVGDNVFIGEFSVIRPGARLGDDVVIHPHVVVHEGVEIGEGVEIFSGAVIGVARQRDVGRSGFSGIEEYTVIGSKSSIGAHAVIHSGVRIGFRASIGEGATLLSGVVVGESATVGPNAVVCRDIPAGGTETGTLSRTLRRVEGGFVHEHGLLESDHIGQGTRIWAHTHILPGARIGKDCNICDQTFIENDVVIGDRVTVKSGVHIWDGARIGDDVFIGPSVVFTNDRFPRSKQYPEQFLGIVIRDKASIGANATLLPGIEIGDHAMIGAGSVVVRDVPPYTLVVGNPARIVRRLSKGSPA